MAPQPGNSCISLHHCSADKTIFVHYFLATLYLKTARGDEIIAEKVKSNLNAAAIVMYLLQYSVF